MQRRSISILNYIQSWRSGLVWVGLYLLFALLGLQHTSFLFSSIASVQTILPMLLMSLTVQWLLIPNLLRNHRMWAYYLLSFFVVGAIGFLATNGDFFIVNKLEEHGYTINENMKEKMAQGLDNKVYIRLKYTFLLMATFAITTISYMLKAKNEIERKTKEENLQLELRYLKAQINPHFLFNALNNIYSLAYIKDDKAPESILRLSEMLRYVTDDCQTDRVSLRKEIHYIENYIDFQRIRMEHEPNVRFVKEVANNDIQIPPMIFQPMVENCFKHSRLENNPQGFIRLYIRQAEERLTFITENSQYNYGQRKEDNERIGIGINNVRQRLNLLFGKDYQLDVTDTAEIYRLELTLNIKNHNA